MSASYKKIDYRVRSAKHVERAIFVDTFKNIPFYRIADYQYVGLGSLFFVDFRLFHKALGFGKMVSIERGDGGDHNRFTYNQPYSCLDMEFGETSAILPKIDYTVPTIVWMDYDGELSSDVLSDVNLLSNKLLGGSFLAVTVNCNELKRKAKNSSSQAKDIDLLTDAVGQDRVPPGTKAGTLNKKGTRNAYYEILVNEIKSALVTKNASLPDAEKIHFQQVFFLHYKDGADMMTVGGFFVTEDQKEMFSNSSYLEQIYFSESNDSIPIEVPVLTTKEILALEKVAPNADMDAIQDQLPDDFPIKEIPPGDIERYLKSYRYLPNYVSAEIS